MVIAGAGGHAVEILSVFEENNFPNDIYFFDDMNSKPGSKLFNRFNILTSISEVQEIFKNDPDFVIGVGKPAVRKLLQDKLSNAGGRLQSVISAKADIGKYGVELGEGLNIMSGAVITARTLIGKGSLIHIHCSVHHDTVIGDYCELSPGCRILGGARIGAYTSVGAGAVILPGIQVGEYAVIGAGAVVTKNVADRTTAFGVPAQIYNKS
jgi:sugar O-acyltransferase (sialic acid O-acetyltransferase NeuD family)